ncbi:MAG: hypothetical protein G01um101416_638 [Microgenomates group bacterium Gr01-1014_16]|nr:MAG: hypothetical protein G01um101416_638 [Microgenomates group bacterium Gr01-1014_16]
MFSTSGSINASTGSVGTGGTLVAVGTGGLVGEEQTQSGDDGQEGLRQKPV